jgi:hypothetical protein
MMIPRCVLYLIVFRGMLRNFVGPRPSFEEKLVRFGPLLDLYRMVEDGSPKRSCDRGSHLFCGLCGTNKGFLRVFLMGYGMSANEFTHD